MGVIEKIRKLESEIETCEKTANEYETEYLIMIERQIKYLEASGSNAELLSNLIETRNEIKQQNILTTT